MNYSNIFDRDTSITQAVLLGSSFVQLSSIYHISSSRIAQIFYKRMRALWFFSKTKVGYSGLIYSATYGVRYFQEHNEVWLKLLSEY